MIRLKDVLAADFCKDNDNIELYVGGEPVWDFKTQNGELRLIHEPVKGSETFKTVTVKEIKKYLTLEEAEYPVKSETVDKEIVEVEGIKKGSKTGLNFMF